MNKRSKTRRALGLVLSLAVALAATAFNVPAHAQGLQTFRGTVTDAIGRPLQGVAISDGNDVAFTDSAGNYTLDESDLNTYTLTPSKVGLKGTSRTVGPVDSLNPINFTMQYVPKVFVTPSSFIPNPPRTVQVTLTSYAPTTSCARWIDPAGTVVPLTISNPVPGGESTWSGTYSTFNMADGRHTFSAELSDCSSSTLLGAPVTGTFVADSVGPSLALLAPRDGSNVLATSQPIVVSANDFLRGTGAGSGIKSSTIAITVRDIAGVEADRRPSASLSGSVIRSQAVSLTPGGSYEVSVSAWDNAGNVTTITSGFYVMTQAYTSPLNNIRLDIPSTTSTSKGSKDTLNDTYTWTNVPATVGAFTVSLRDTQHAGDGTVRITVPTSQARVTYSIAGVPGLAVAPVEASRDVSVSYTVDAVGSVDAAVTQQSAAISSLTAVVPKNADAGSVKLSLVDARPTATAFPLCADPTVASGCSPDPLPNIGLQLLAQFDTNVSGGTWALVTSEGATAFDSVVRQTGTVPANGRVAVGLSKALAQRSTNNRYILRAVKAVDANSARVALVTAGFSSTDVASGATRHLGAPASELVSLYDTPAAAAGAAACSTCGGVVGSAGPRQTPGGSSGDVEPVPGWGDPTHDYDGPETQNDLVSCSTAGACDMVTPPTQQSRTPAQCGGIGYTDCTLDSKEWTQKVFRGHSQRPVGARSRFQVEASNTQAFQAGSRVKAGPFSISGTEKSRKETSWTDSYNRRGSCYPTNPNLVCDVDADDDGRRSQWGNDRWRWERHLTGQPICSDTSCFMKWSVEEYVFDAGYIGPNTDVGPVDYTNQYRHPAVIRTECCWANYGPGYQTDVYKLKQAVTYTYGASMKISFQESYGEAEFNAEVTNDTYQKVGYSMEFRNDLPWMNDPRGGAMKRGNWYKYDNWTNGRWEYWSCEYASGWQSGQCFSQP